MIIKKKIPISLMVILANSFQIWSAPHQNWLSQELFSTNEKFLYFFNDTFYLIFLMLIHFLFLFFHLQALIFLLSDHFLKKMSVCKTIFFNFFSYKKYQPKIIMVSLLAAKKKWLPTNTFTFITNDSLLVIICYCKCIHTVQALKYQFSF